MGIDIPGISCGATYNFGIESYPLMLKRIIMKQGISKYKYLTGHFGFMALSVRWQWSYRDAAANPEVEPQARCPPFSSGYAGPMLPKRSLPPIPTCAAIFNVAFAPIAIESLGSDDTKKEARRAMPLL